MRQLTDPRASGPSYQKLTEDEAYRIVYEEPGRIRGVLEDITAGYDAQDLASLLIDAHYALDKFCQGLTVGSLCSEDLNAFRELANTAKRFYDDKEEAINHYVNVLIDEAYSS